MTALYSAPASQHEGIRDARILIADDTQLILESLTRELVKEKYDVTCAKNGREAITRLHANHFDLVITDLVMPEVGGIELLQEIKKTDPGTSVIIFTGHGDMNSAINALRLGADDYVLKPCEVDELLLRVSNCLEKRSLLRQLKEQNTRLMTEIVERKRLEEELRDYAEKVKFFSYSIAHDIKAPATSLHGLVHRLVNKFNGNLPEKAHRYCAQIVYASQQIVTLVDQINSYVSAKESPLKFDWIELNKVIRSVKKEFALQLDARHIRFVSPKKLPAIRADGTALVRVLRNCMDNALKYGGNELRQIELDYRQTSKFHMLSMKNDGKAMTRDECETVFEVFKRQQSSRGITGTGLGLAIVKELIHQHQGEVWAEPGDKKGVCFHMSIARNL